MIVRWAVCTAMVMVLAACADRGTGTAPATGTEPSLVEEPDWANLFEEHGVEGTFVLREIGDTTIRVHDPARARRAEIPASTFKILNSLIALETGVVADVDTAIDWDGVERSVAAWNRDHSLRTGIEVSAVWLYQEIAREVGSVRMAEMVDAADYGNADIGGPIDEFWLRGALRISPVEQIDFLARLVTGDLPFDLAHVDAVREILVRESGPGWVWAHKTGTALAAEPVLGWLVGFTEYEGREWVYAMNLDLGTIDLPEEIEPEVRQLVARSILERAGALPAGSG
ncbi:MAG: penicillin-binding transpeptidase domain-containing protein [Acidimicrobiales bacterium]|nr:penicillin-binding transpeptidase domain-containing protein [Acidimicrobiales bacterium]